MTRKACEEASKAGVLPHEWLLSVMRGEEIDGHKPEFSERMDAAKACAPYFAPRLAATTVDATLTNIADASQLSNDQLAHIATGGRVTPSVAPQGS